MKCIELSLIILILPLYSFSQDSLQLSGVNGWRLEKVRPAPYNVFDTLNTGMRILPYEEGSTDSIQLFRMYANTRKIVEDWGVDFRWYRYQLTQPQFELPSKTHINLNVNEIVDVEYINFGIWLHDTSGIGFSSLRYDWIEIQPGWNTVEMLWDNSTVTNVHHIEVTFTLWGDDSSYIGADILLDSLIFFDENNNAFVVDNFGGESTNSIGSLSYLNPTRIILDQNFPNPFNSSTVIKYSIPQLSNVSIKIFNMLGEKVTTLVNEEKYPGEYQIEFNTVDLSSGIYFYQLSAGDFILTKKMILLK